MPRKKKIEEKEVVAKKIKEEEVAAKVNPILPVIDHVQVVEILDDGKSSETHFHCLMEDGTTRHIERRLFQ